MSRIDWSQAGKRIRFSPRVNGRSPDWNLREQRWKDEADYAGEELTPRQVVNMALCAICDVPAGETCFDALGREMDHPHPERVRLAGEQVLADHAAAFEQEKNGDRTDD